MPKKQKPYRLLDLIMGIWKNSPGRDTASPRFCLEPRGGADLHYKGKIVTHYDFIWKELGLHAVLFLYQGEDDGEITYGAVLDEHLKQIGEVDYYWDQQAKKFITKNQAKNQI